MARAGRKPKPTVVKRREGNPGKRALNKGEPKPTRLAKIPVPAWLGRYGKAEWVRLADELDSLGLLTSLDVSAFEAYCSAYDDWRAARVRIKRDGKVQMSKQGWSQQQPCVSMERDARKAMLAAGALLGLNPSDRGRLDVSTRDRDRAEEFFGDGTNQ